MLPGYTVASWTNLLVDDIMMDDVRWFHSTLSKYMYTDYNDQVNYKLIVLYTFCLFCYWCHVAKSSSKDGPDFELATLFKEQW